MAALLVLVMALMLPDRVTVPQAAPDSTPSLTRADAVATALRVHPLLAATRAALEAADAQFAEARSARLPAVAVAMSATRWDWVMPNKKIYLDDSRTDVFGQLSAEQLLYDGGARATSIRIADRGRAAAGLSIEESKLQVAFEVERAYLNALGVERLVAVHEASVNALRDHATTARLLYEVGRVSHVDVLKTGVQLAMAENDLSSARSAVAAARIELAAAMGIDSLGSVRLVDSLDQGADTAVTGAQWRARIRGHPAIAAAELVVREREDGVALARSAFFPRLFVQGAYSREGGGLIPGHPNWQVGVGVSVPVFDGGVRKAGVAGARARAGEAAFRLAGVRLQLEAELEADRVRLEEARRRAASAADVVRLAEESLRAAALRYEAGQGAVLDVLDSETTLLRVRTDQVEALADVALVLAALRRDAGVIPVER